ncbi:unnamed protein product [Malus baccata var. baccata]
MAEGVLFNVAGGIIERLGPLASQEIGLIWGARDEFQKLKVTVAGFQAVLLDAEQKQANNEVKEWLQSVEDAVYEADDVLDEYNTENQLRQMMPGSTKLCKEVRIFFSSSNQLVFGLMMGHRIKDINKRISEVASRRPNYLKDNCEDTRFIKRESVTHSFVPKENIIGRDEDTRAIIQLLLHPISTKNVSTISIVGIGGLGKTALARLIFNDQEIQNHFELKMWTCVSNVFELDILAKKILKQLDKHHLERVDKLDVDKLDVDKLDMDQLQNNLREKVDGKKYLLVLDDVWNEDQEKWLSLKDLLVGGGEGVRTLNRFVLSESNCLGRGGSAGLTELGRLKELRGQLVISKLSHHVVSESNVGTPLKDKQHLHSLEFWWKEGEDVKAVDEEDIIKSMEVLQPHSNLKQLTVLYYGGVRFASWFSSLINIVNLTFWNCNRCQHLPPLDHLPSLKKLELRSLEKLEYISEKESSNSMSDEMMRISFFPSLETLLIEDCPVLKGWWRAHTHNTASSSSSTEILSLPSFPSLSRLQIWNCPNLTSMPLYPNVEIIFLNGSSWKVVESLFVRGASDITHDVGVDVSASSSSPHLSKLTHLSLCRIEDLEFIPSEGMGNQTSLQELVIDHCPNLAALPEGIANLTSLQSLRIDHCPNLAALPEGIANLTSLQSLSIGNFPNLAALPEWIANLTSLQSLSIGNFPNLAALPEGIANLTSLQSLSIGNFPNLAALPEGIANLTSLQSLSIGNFPNLAALPEGIANLTSLQSLSIGNFPNWAALPEWIANLTSLQSLSIDNFPKLAALPEEISNLTSLRRLHITHCSNLASLPEGIRGFPCLNRLYIFDCPMLLQRYKKETGKDWHKVAHIPYLTIY